jgi:hypothetical protein
MTILHTPTSSTNTHQARIGVLRLDGWGNQRATRTGSFLAELSRMPASPSKNPAYVPLIGDVDDARSFQHPVVATVAKGCTWEALKDPANWTDPDFLEDIKAKAAASFASLLRHDVRVIVANCGLFMWLHAKGIVSPAMDQAIDATGYSGFRPMVSLSSLNLLSYTLPLYDVLPNNQGLNSQELVRTSNGATVAIFTSNEDACVGIIQSTPALAGYNCFTHKQAKACPRLKQEGGILVVGLNGDNVIGVDGPVAGFEVVNDGTAAFYDVLEPSIHQVALGVKKEYPGIRLAVVECTEVSAYTDSIRLGLRVPVYDPISMTSAMLDSFIPHQYQQLNHEERADYIQHVLQSPKGSMDFELQDVLDMDDNSMNNDTLLLSKKPVEKELPNLKRISPPPASLHYVSDDQDGSDDEDMFMSSRKRPSKEDSELCDDSPRRVPPRKKSKTQNAAVPHAVMPLLLPLSSSSNCSIASDQPIKNTTASRPSTVFVTNKTTKSATCSTLVVPCSNLIEQHPLDNEEMTRSDDTSGYISDTTYGETEYSDCDIDEDRNRYREEVSGDFGCGRERPHVQGWSFSGGTFPPVAVQRVRAFAPPSDRQAPVTAFRIVVP